jgi:pimeloyl-ACP methyl ester carboxylesterase
VPSGSEYVLATRETPWSRFLACDLPAAIEAQLGGLCPPDRRLLAGQSTGGFNALMLAMTHPGVFGTVVASSPDALDFEAWLLDARGRIRDEWLTWMRFEDLLGGEGAMRSYAHAWSSPSDGRVEWPACLDTGEVAADTLERWLRETPARLVETDSGRQALDALGGRLFIGCATQDEFDLFDPTVRFCRRLDGLAVRHECVVDSGSHFDVQARLARLLRRALDASLPAAGDP